jgi:hypothetical protein
MMNAERAIHRLSFRVHHFFIQIPVFLNRFLPLPLSVPLKNLLRNGKAKKHLPDLRGGFGSAQIIEK